MQQIWAGKYTQETGIKRTIFAVWLCNFILIQWGYSCPWFMKLHFVHATLSQIGFFKFVMRRWPTFLAFWKKISKKIIESRYIGIFLIIGKIIDIDMKFLNLSVIWRDYRQNYRYRNWLEIYRKIIDIEKNDLSPTPMCDTHCTGGFLHTLVNNQWTASTHLPANVGPT